MRSPTNLYISYAPEDEPFKNELIKHLAALVQNQLIKIWENKRLSIGSTRAEELRQRLQDSDIVLLLISADFIASPQINTEELQPAISLHRAGQLKIIPVILRPCLFDDLPFQKFEALPKNAKPIIEWSNRDRAFLDVIANLKRIIQNPDRQIPRFPSPHHEEQYEMPHQASNTGYYHLVSCNRMDVMANFWRNFQWKETFFYQCQYFFLIGQDFGQANSLVKRIHFELQEYRPGVREIVAEDFEPSFWRTKNSLTVDHLKVDLKRLITKTLGLRHDVHSIEHLTANLDKKYFKLKTYRYIPIAIELKLTSACWQRTVERSLDWLITEFSRLDQPVPQNYIFFIILKLTNEKKKGFSIWSRPRKTNPDVFRSAIANFADRYNAATLLPQLSHVDHEDIDDWLYNYYEKNQRLRHQKLKGIIGSLKGSGPWHMSDVEIILRKFIAEHRDKL